MTAARPPIVIRHNTQTEDVTVTKQDEINRLQTVLNQTQVNYERRIEEMPTVFQQAFARMVSEALDEYDGHTRFDPVTRRWRSPVSFTKCLHEMNEQSSIQVPSGLLFLAEAIHDFDPLMLRRWAGLAGRTRSGDLFTLPTAAGAAPNATT